MPQVSSPINAYASFFCLLTGLQHDIFFSLLLYSPLLMGSLKYPSPHLPLSLFWAHARSRKSAWVNHARKTNCASRASEREGGRREEVWWTDADADTNAGRSSSVQIRGWERRVEEKEGEKGRGATLSCTGMKMTQGQYSQDHLFSPAPSLHIHQQEVGGGEKGHCIHGNGRTAVGSSQEARWGTVTCSSLSLSGSQTFELICLLIAPTCCSLWCVGGPARQKHNWPQHSSQWSCLFLVFEEGKINQQAGSSR